MMWRCVDMVCDVVNESGSIGLYDVSIVIYGIKVICRKALVIINELIGCTEESSRRDK